LKKEDLALILIDIQKDFWRPYEANPKFKSFPGNIRSLLTAARERGITIIHTQAYFKQDRGDWMLFYRPQGRGNVPCIEGTVGAEFEEFSEPLMNEHVVRKQTFDGFVDTDLANILKENGIKVALIGGLETSVCVLFTATSVYLKRIVPVVISDACADDTQRHESTLKMYDKLCFLTTTTHEVLNEWEKVMKEAEPFIVQRAR
jgi:nicotinamidase-related amidase